MQTHTFLIELGTEELPAHGLATLAHSFAQALQKELDQAALRYQKVQWFATPRRLALQVIQLAAQQPDRLIEIRGPAITHAFNAQQQPTPAAYGWAKRCSITLAQAEIFKNEQGRWLIYRAKQVGERAEKLLPCLVQRAVAQISYPKMMRWGNREDFFVRPVHTVTLLLDDQLLAGTLFGVSAQRTLLGHRFMGSQQIALQHAKEYLETLYTQGYVIADHHQRKACIRRDILQAAAHMHGQVQLNEELLEEVTGLVEWPVVFTASFEACFLQLPPEVLVHTLQHDQRYFPLYDQQQKLLPHFVFVANIKPDDPTSIIRGNERVVRSRLADAQFFFNSDRERTLLSRLPQLAEMLFQQQLGTLQDKAHRIEILSGWIAEVIGANRRLAQRAGLLAKCDLATQMVFEFPAIQGTMGMYYAHYDGEDEEVAAAVQTHYQPRFSKDGVPTHPIACAVAIADKIDTIVGIIGVGQRPTGDKDPYALRRAALGIVRIIIENQLPLELYQVTQQAQKGYAKQCAALPQITQEVVAFIHARLCAWYQEQGFSIDLIQAIAAHSVARPSDFHLRLQALAHFCSHSKQKNALISSYKRVDHLLAKTQTQLPEQIDSLLLQKKEEQQLQQQITMQQQQLALLIQNQNYTAALHTLTTLQGPIDAFFTHVQVLVDNGPLRFNRLRLLYEIRQLFLQIADFALLN